MRYNDEDVIPQRTLRVALCALFVVSFVGIPVFVVGMALADGRSGDVASSPAPGE